MRILVLSSVFPNPRQPVLGVFVRERMRRVARHCGVIVVAPTPWFPFNALIRGPQWSGIPVQEAQGTLRVCHPRFFCIPRHLKWLDAFCYACSLLPALRRLRREFPFQLIDAHFAYPDGVAAVILGRVFRTPVMITLRGSIVRLSGYPLHRPQLRWALQQAAGIVAVSESLKQVAIEIGIPAGKIRVIPNGVDTEQFRPGDRVTARAACALPADRRIMLSVGGIYDGKGHHLVVEALRGLVGRHPDLLYVVVGGERPGDNYRKSLERTIQAHGLTRHVLFAGSRPHGELPRWYAAADLFCLATRSEGWANVLLESIASGVPVVTTRVGGNAEIVRDGRDGYLVPFGDVRALTTAIEDALMRNWDRNDLAAHARSHTWERGTDEVLEEFGRLLREPTPEAGVVSSSAPPDAHVAASSAPPRVTP